MTPVDLGESCSGKLAKLAYTLNGFARYAGHCGERVTRPDNTNIVSRIGYLSQAIICSCLAVPCSILATPVFLISWCLGEKGGIVVKTNQNVSDDIIQETVKILFINGAFQSGMLPAITADMTSPYDEFSEQYPSREEATVAFLEKYQVNTVCISEAHDLSSMNKLEELLRAKGFTNFIKHPPTNPIFVNSGLFVASKKPISDAEFIAYPLKMRSGIHLGAEQGCITFVIKEGKKTVRVASTHLSYGKNSHESRTKQLKKVFDILPQDQTTIFGGDFNYEYMKKMEELKKLADGHTIRSLLPEGTETTRVVFQKGEGIGRKSQGPKEVVDAAILVNGDKGKWSAVALKPKVEAEDPYFTDHWAILVIKQFS